MRFSIERNILSRNAASNVRTATQKIPIIKINNHNLNECALQKIYNFIISNIIHLRRYSLFVRFGEVIGASTLWMAHPLRVRCLIIILQKRKRLAQSSRGRRTSSTGASAPNSDPCQPNRNELICGKKRALKQTQNA